MDNQNNKNKNNKNNKQGLSFIILVTLITTILVLALYQFQMTGDKEVSYDEFLKMVDKGKSRKSRNPERQDRDYPEEGKG